MKEDIVEVKKVWGKEVILVSNDEYCGKLLHLDKDATSSYHLHPIKKETFYALEGVVSLTIEGKDYILNPFARTKTIMPGQKHSFHGISRAIILEVSTHDDPNDCVRFSTSQAGEA